MSPVHRSVQNRERRRIDDSPDAVQQRMDEFINRTRGWGQHAITAELPSDIVVLAGPTRRNPRLK